MISIKRAYDPAAETDGWRVLVDRLWPRGLSKEKLALDDWLKEISPSDELRRWFDHKPERFAEFTKKYQEELKNHPDAWKALLKKAHRQRITLIYGAKDPENNHAIVLKQFLDSQK